MDNNDTVSVHRNDAIAAPTAPARHTYTSGAQLDFADVMARILASAAANVGGTDHLLAGRYGSWEAGLVGSLVTGTVPEYELLRYRTEPIVVPLNVAQLVTEASSVARYDDAWKRLIEKHGDVDPQSEWWRESACRNPTDFEGDPLVWRLWSQAYEAVGAPDVDAVASQSA